MNDWIDEFFECDVGFELKRIEGKAAPYNKELQELLEGFVAVSQTESVFCALPMVVGEGKVVQILIGARTSEEAAELRSIADAYIGSAYALVGKEVLTTPVDQASAVILKRLSGGIVRVRVPRGDEEQEAYRARTYKAMRIVLEMLDQYGRRPPMLRETRRPTGRILRDLFVALRSQDPDIGYACLEELKSMQALSARNLVYLELQIKDELGDWLGVLNHPRLPEILPARLPGRVVVALLRSIERSLSLTDISKHNVETLRESVMPMVALFERRPDLSRREGKVGLWRTWAAGAALVGNQYGVFQLYDDFGDEWIAKLCDAFDWRIPPEAQDLNKEAGLQHLLASPESDELAAELLKQVVHCEDDEYRQIVERLAGFSHQAIARLRQKAPLRRIWDATVGTDESECILAGWTQWLDKLDSDPEPEALVQLAIEGAVHWDKSTWDEGLLIQATQNPSAQALKALRNVLPILLNWLEEHQLSLRPKSIESLLIGLALDDITSIPDLSLSRDLLEMAVEEPHDRDTYSAMLDAVSVIWDKAKSVYAVPVMFDIFDLLLDAPCPIEISRRSLWELLQEFLLASWRRIEPEYRVLAKSFSDELVGSSHPFDGLYDETSSGEPVDSIDLSGKKVAIYTLMEKAAQRAKITLECLFSGLRVELNHDHTATPSLVHLSRNADYFVFAARSATHQAFFPVTQRRGDIIYPKGKGTASIVRAFCEAVGAG